MCVLFPLDLQCFLLLSPSLRHISECQVLLLMFVKGFIYPRDVYSGAGVSCATAKRSRKRQHHSMVPARAGNCTQASPSCPHESSVLCPGVTWICLGFVSNWASGQTRYRHTQVWEGGGSLRCSEPNLSFPFMLMVATPGGFQRLKEKRGNCAEKSQSAKRSKGWILPCLHRDAKPIHTDFAKMCELTSACAGVFLW